MRILLATDGSENAKDAAMFLLRLPSSDRIKLTVLTVTYDPKATSHGNVQPWFPEWNKHERETVQKHHGELEKLFVDRFASISMLHRKGNATQTVLNLAKDIDADLIVMGAVGHSMISRMMLGSISDDVATRAECSVLIVRPSKAENTTTEAAPKIAAPKITIAFDESTPSKSAIDEQLGLNWGEEASINVLTVMPAQYDYFMGDGLSPVVLKGEQEIFESMQGSAERASDKIAQSIPNAHFLAVRGNHVGESIIQHAQKNGSDLIVTGDGSHGVLHDILIGNTTKYILRHSPCSVWISRHHHLHSDSEKPQAEKAAAS